jgi:DNA mismatch repair ATPase MutL
MRNHQVQKQTLLQPISVPLVSQLEYVAMNYIDVLRENGFEIQVNMDASSMNRIQLVQVPQLRNLVLGISDFEEIVTRISQGESRPICSKIRASHASKACRTSVMIGMALTRSKMKTIVTRMGGMLSFDIIFCRDESTMELSAWKTYAKASHHTVVKFREIKNNATQMSSPRRRIETDVMKL